LLTQAAGRSGRRDRPGQVIVQTHCPDHYAIQAASRHDYLSFYEQELEMRREPAYPPFARLANVIASAQEEEQAKQAVEGFSEACAQAQSGPSVELIGPAPAPWARLKGRFRWHLLLRATEHEPIRRVIQAAREQWRPSPKVTLSIDIDPVSLM
jgi:primosomal protein N' (replication factor Y)